MIDPATHVGRVDLSVQDLDRSLGFWSRVLGLEALPQDDGSAVLRAGDREVLRLVPGATAPAPGRATGLFHVAVRYPTRRALAAALAKMARAGVRLSGASDHGVSEALYLADPDGHGVELYRDRPREDWPRTADGSVDLYTLPLDLEPISALVTDEDLPGTPTDPGTDIGHVHLKVSDLQRSTAFYRDAIGLSLQARYGEEASFLAAGDYHHHLGLNIWMSRAAGPPPPGAARLERFELVVPGATEDTALTDPDGNALVLTAAA